MNTFEGIGRQSCSAWWLSFVSLLLVLNIVGSGCDRHARLASRVVDNRTVTPVTLFGQTLDKKATPEQVAYVALRLIQDDFRAPTIADREAVLDQELEIAAVNVIREACPKGMQTGKFVFNVVKRWTPTVSHYVDDFETEWESAKARLVKSRLWRLGDSEPAAMQCAVFMNVADPSGDPNAGVVMAIWLVQDSGFWRVSHLGFENQGRTIEAIRTAQAHRRTAPTLSGG